MGAALAHPRAQDDVSIELPNGDDVDVADAPTNTDEAALENLAQDEKKTDEVAAEADKSPFSNDQNPAQNDAIAAEAATIYQPDPNSDLPQNPPLQVNLGPDSTSVASQISSESSSEELGLAMLELAGTAVNAGQAEKAIADINNEVVEQIDNFVMEPRFSGPRGALEATLNVKHNGPELEGGYACQQADGGMRWVDNEDHGPAKLTLGGTYTLGVHVWLYRDPECKSRIDQDDAWPGPEYPFLEKDPVPFYYKWIELTDGQLKGTEDLPNGQRARLIPGMTFD
ncbi:hypothetical protein AA313_de0205947 [Arthrobotrys entomopaga]|nr:hypothetical protein AA313_de0205947 [Arthrobotrys entomopaga]